MTCPDDPNALAPFRDLAPHDVLDAVDAAGWHCDGRLLQLNSYENRVFQLGLDDGRMVVAKFYRPGRWSDAQILEEHAFATELVAAEVPVIAPLAVPAAASASLRVAGTPPTLATVSGWRLAVTPRCGGRSPEFERAGTLEWIGRFLARLHVVGQRERFRHRLSIEGTTAARAARDWLAAQPMLDEPARSAWLAITDEVLQRAQALFERAGDVASLRLHGDCHVGNLLWTEAGPHFVDLDDACNGPAVQDLWMLLSGDRQERSAQLREVLAGYESLREFDRRELALIEALRTLRIIQHSVWIARRWDDPAFPIAFPGFASPAYWQQQVTQVREQLEALEEAPLVA